MNMPPLSRCTGEFKGMGVWLSDDEMRILKKHYYGLQAQSGYLDLIDEIVKQLLEEAE